MKNRALVVFVCALCLCYVQGFPHQSTEESDDSTEASEAGAIVVVPFVVSNASTIASETSNESHETKSREEEDRGSVSDSGEAKSPDDYPNDSEDLARFADDVPKMSEEETRSPVYHPKMAEDAAKMAEEATKVAVEKLDDAVTKLIEDLPKLGGEETRSPVFRPKIIDAEKMAEGENSQSKMIEEKVKEEEAKGGEEDGKGTDEDESDEDGGGVKFPKTESLCPARPEEITKIESECAEEYKQWKVMRAKKFAQQTAVEKTTEATTTTATTTTIATTTTVATTIEVATTTKSATITTEAVTEPVKMLEISLDEFETTTNEPAGQLLESTIPASDLTDSHDDLQSLPSTASTIPMEAEDEILEEEVTKSEVSDEVVPETEVPREVVPGVEVPGKEVPEIEVPGEEVPGEEVPTVETSTVFTTDVEMELDTLSMGRKKRSTKKVTKKRSCYPATCILRKLNLLDSMGQPSIERIQSFAINMTVDDKTNLEQKAVGCVKEINEAMIDASADIGKKVGCVAQKVISCLNKGLMCPIMKVPQ